MKDEVSESLRALAVASEHRSKMGRIRLLYSEIETARLAGVSLETVLETLNEHGLGTTLGTFKSMLHRVRQELKEKGTIFPDEKPSSKLTPKREDSQAQENRPEPHIEQAERDIEGEGEGEGAIRLSAKQRREKLAEKFIKPEATNPLLRKFNSKETK